MSSFSAGSSDAIGCAAEAARQNAGTLRTFKEDVAAIDFPSDAATDVTTLRQRTDAFISDYDALSRATSPSDYGQIASTMDLAQDATAFDRAVNEVFADLETTDGP